MKKIYTLVMAVAVTFAANAQTKSTSTSVHMSNAGVPSLSNDRTVTDTLVGPSWSNVGAVGPTLYGSSGGAGYVCGNNGYGDQAKAQAFINTIGTVAVDGAIIWFAAKQHDAGAPATSKITVKEYALDGPGTNNGGAVTTAPGTVHASLDVVYSAIDTGFSYVNGAHAYMFTTPPVVTSDFAIGVDFSTLGAGDTVGIISSTDPDGTGTGAGDAQGTDMAWEKWSGTGGWHTIYSAWPLDIDLFIWALVDQSAGIQEQGFLNGARLSQNMPNPANSGSTIIGYEIQNNVNNVSLMIFDVTGKGVATYTEGDKTAGKYFINVNTSNLDAGVYYYALTAGKGRIAHKMVVTK